MDLFELILTACLNPDRDGDELSGATGIEGQPTLVQIRSMKTDHFNHEFTEAGSDRPHHLDWVIAGKFQLIQFGNRQK